MKQDNELEQPQELDHNPDLKIFLRFSFSTLAMLFCVTIYISVSTMLQTGQEPAKASPTFVEVMVSKWKRKIEIFRECPDCPKMVVMSPGYFKMGDFNNAGSADERPVHRVNIAYSFAVGKFEVTQTQWQSVMGRNPSGFKGKNRPVENVSWEDVQDYLRKLNQRLGLSGQFNRYRLLTESEWEYAARAGRSTKYSWGNKASHKFANYGNNKCCTGMKKGRDKWVNTSPVGKFAANLWGLYDMHGNVWEWTEDCKSDSYAEKTDDGSASTIENCRHRVIRGGSWADDPRSVRVADRGKYDTRESGTNVGFRIAKTFSR
jgi:formylglycine-generating enzyme required for sulfatase activity